ncbi:MAG: hypothetical protein UE775_03300 [Segatella copri]|nr:hypothetical protein [Segatella copri]
MKKLNKYRKSVQGLMLLTFGLTMAGCSAQDDFFTETSSESLSIKPSVTEATVSRAVASDIDLHEAALDNLYVKIFDQEYKEQSVNKKFESNLRNNQKEVLGKGNWKVDLNLQENKDYFVYSIANAKENLRQVNSLDDLENKVQTDEDIWKPDSSDNATKNFLMTTKSPWTVSKEPTQTIDSKLTRAAAKIVVNLKINVEGYEVVGEPTWQLLNYNTQTTLFGPNTANSIASMSEAEAMKKTTDGYQLVTYSYATSWIDNASAPQAKIKVMLKKGEETTPVDYYYSIPVRDPKETKKSLDRNYVYTAKATVTSLGSSSDITYGDAMNLVYDVQKWTQGEETTINAGDQKYLLVSPTFMIMKNQRFDNSTIKFYGSGKCTVETSEIYYYDKNGNKQACSGSQYFNASANYAKGHGELKDKGTIVIGDANNTTNDFVPLSVKYIKIKVTCEGVEDTVNVTIKQYPLEYIQGIAGWYSTKSIDGWIDWQRDQDNHKPQKTSSDNNFHAKVKIGAEIYQYNDNRHWNYGNSYYKAEKGNIANDEQYNNQMYVVQITSTEQGSNYKIGHVKNTSYSTENVVSPAFMLASQLGTVSAHSTGESASQHCNDYVEVSKDGMVYDDWRLPTPAEIGVITKYQYNESQNVITEVLKGRYYWALNHQKIETRIKNSGTGTRCVRDLSLEEVKALENKNE